MKKITLLIFTLFTFVNLFALEVNKNELESLSSEYEIEFINYSGPHYVVQSAAAIKGIGSNIGKEISDSLAEPKTEGNQQKYYVIHAIDDSVGKLDADILFLGADAGVDHIKNLRRIISGYLESAYGYSSADSETLAVFITVYNAVYRGNKDSFEKKYKEVVLKNLSENCGLSVNYEDWPGKTEIVIPLFDFRNAGLSSVDTSVISDSNVVKSMKDDDGMNIETRKDLVDLKERESDIAYDNAKDAQKDAVEQQKILEAEKEKQAELEKEAADANKYAEENPGNKKAQEQAEAKNEELEKQKETVANQEEKTKEAQETAKNQQAISDKKQSEAQSERKDISRDQKEVQKQKDELAKISADYSLLLSDEKNMLSALVKFNTSNGDILKKSPFATIRNREIYKVSEGYLAIAGENKGKGAVKLVIISPESLEIVYESNEILNTNSVLTQKGNDYYCVITESKKNFVGKYNEKLELLVKSAVEVSPSTAILTTDSGIVVTDAKGNLKVLSFSTLD